MPPHCRRRCWRTRFFGATRPGRGARALRGAAPHRARSRRSIARHGSTCRGSARPRRAARGHQARTDGGVRRLVHGSRGHARRESIASSAERAHIGERFLDRYLVWMSSGSTGEPGIYVQDAGAWPPTTRWSARSSRARCSPAATGRRWPRKGGRSALVTADTDHFASIASWRRLRAGQAVARHEELRRHAAAARHGAATQRVSAGVRVELPDVLALLADEQARGAARDASRGLWSGGEGLSRASRGARSSGVRDVRCSTNTARPSASPSATAAARAGCT